MKKYRPIAACVAGCLLIAALLAPLGGELHRGDVNGDSATNVLDLQLLAMEMIAGAEQGQAADLNRDGRIDVLDFQMLLQQTTQPDPVPETRPTEAKAVMLTGSRIAPEQTGFTFAAGAFDAKHALGGAAGSSRRAAVAACLTPQTASRIARREPSFPPP